MEKENIKIFGDHEESTLAQITRSASHEAVRGAVLCADGHKGYAVPIGGVIAYEDKISPSGVGYDIACIAAGSRVTTSDGYTLPVEDVSAAAALTCWDGEQVRPVVGHEGRIATGVKPVFTLSLSNRRSLTVTADHQVLTPDGWKPAGELTATDKIACPTYVGLPYEPVTCRATGSGEVSDDIVQALLTYQDDARLAALVRLLGVVSGDGHIAKSGGYLGVYTTDATDAAAMAEDFVLLGYQPSVYTRSRKPGHMDEIQVRVNSRRLVALFTLLGSPVGRKAWEERPLRWLFAMPAWVRAQFLSAFGSAECMTPRPHNRDIPNLQIKQSGENDNALRFIGRLFESLCFSVTIAPSGPPRGERRDHVLQIVGGACEQVRYFEEIGFCYAQKKRQRAAETASVIWQRLAQQGVREAARHEAKALHGAGGYWKDVRESVAAKYGVSEGFVQHAMYETRAILRRQRGTSFAPETTGELCWVPVLGLTAAGEAAVYDIVTIDAAHSFLAEGMVVHNCGNKAVRLDIPASQVRGKIKKIMDDVWSHLEFGIGRTNDTHVDHELFDDETWKLSPMKSLKQMARNQLGTIGSGNHYLDIFADEQDRTWIGAHFGSRGLGHKTATFFLEAGGAKDGMDVDPLVLDARSPLGEDYLACMALAGRYAYAGRDWVCAEVARLLEASILEEVHNHHNFAWKETHGGRDLWVVRKGATPAFPGQKGFVGGSMGDQSVILEGVASDEATDALHSTVHGAGRVMSRTQARGKVNRKTGQVISPGVVSREMMQEWLREKNVELRGAGTDESPHCYKRLPNVLAYHAKSIRILHTLTPLGVAMAGEDIVDPFKD